jgi:hypothetical protein
MMWYLIAAVISEGAITERGLSTEMSYDEAD